MIFKKKHKVTNIFLKVIFNFSIYRKMQIITLVSYHMERLLPTTPNIINSGKDVSGKGDSSTALVGLQISTTTSENSMKGPHKIKIELLYASTITLLFYNKK